MTAPAPDRPFLSVIVPVHQGAAVLPRSLAAIAASDLPHLVVRGRRGGSAITAAAVNAIASDVE